MHRWRAAHEAPNCSKLPILHIRCARGGSLSRTTALATPRSRLVSRGDGATDSLPARGAPKVPRCRLCMSSVCATTRWHPGGQLCAHVTRWRAPTSCERTSPEPLRGASKTRRRMKFNEKPERAARAVTERCDRRSERDTRTTSSAHLP
jgi:hypothetical protein